MRPRRLCRACRPRVQSVITMSDPGSLAHLGLAGIGGGMLDKAASPAVDGAFFLGSPGSSGGVGSFCDFGIGGRAGIDLGGGRRGRALLWAARLARRSSRSGGDPAASARETFLLTE